MTEPGLNPHVSKRNVLSMSHLSLPLHGVDENDALWQPFIRDQDLVQLIVNRLPGNL